MLQALREALGSCWDRVVQMPFVTRALFLANVLMYLLQFVAGFGPSYFCRSPFQIHPENFDIQNSYRLILSDFVHAGPIHLLFNMLCLQWAGSELERLMGSFRFYSLTVFAFATSLIAEFSLAWAIYYLPIFSSDSFLLSCSLGFSGILFCYIVIISQLSTAPTQSIFGFFDIRTKYYPIALLLFLQLFGGNISFLGHLGGIISGYIYLCGFFDSIFPCRASQFESNELSWLINLPGWIPEMNFSCHLNFQKIFYSENEDGQQEKMNDPWIGQGKTIV